MCAESNDNPAICFWDISSKIAKLSLLVGLEKKVTQSPEVLDSTFGRDVCKISLQPI